MFPRLSKHIVVSLVEKMTCYINPLHRPVQLEMIINFLYSCAGDSFKILIRGGGGMAVDVVVFSKCQMCCLCLQNEEGAVGTHMKKQSHSNIYMLHQYCENFSSPEVAPVTSIDNFVETKQLLLIHTGFWRSQTVLFTPQLLRCQHEKKKSPRMSFPDNNVSI